MNTDIAQRLLLERRQQLHVLIGSIDADRLRRTSEREDLVELSAVDQHPADIGTETFDRERDLSILAQAEADLVAVEQALQRLEHGTFGTCEACGKEIDEARLLAEPATRFCLDDMLDAEADARLNRR